MDISPLALLIFAASAALSFWVGRWLSRGRRQKKSEQERAAALAEESRQMRRSSERRARRKKWQGR